MQRIARGFKACNAPAPKCIMHRQEHAGSRKAREGNMDLWLALTWGSPIGLGIFFVGLGMLFWGISKLRTK